MDCISNAQLHKSAECSANVTCIDACEHERGSRYQYNRHIETVGSIDTHEVCGALREGWELARVCNTIKTNMNFEEIPQ